MGMGPFEAEVAFEIGGGMSRLEGRGMHDIAVAANRLHQT